MDHEARVALRRLAEGQRGLFSAAQAADVGISHAYLSRATAEGYFRRVRQGVYAVAGAPPSRWEPVLAAALRAGPEAVISHSTAASIHRFHCSAPIPAAIELTILLPARAKLAGAVVHRASVLAPEDVVRRYGIALTSPARTLVDMAGRLSPALLERTLDEGLLANVWRVSDVSAALGRASGNVAGRSLLTSLLDDRRERPSADSVLEAKAFRAMRPLAPFEVHYELQVGSATYVLDAAWPSRRVGAEVVGRRFRVVSKYTFDRERRKLNALAAAGWKIAHLTAAMSPGQMVEAVQLLLAGGGQETG